nr:translocated intimin receptor Tir [Edaphobacter flagellatus]
MDFATKTKAVITDSHFLVPFFVLVAGIALLVWIH